MEKYSNRIKSNTVPSFPFKMKLMELGSHENFWFFNFSMYIHTFVIYCTCIKLSKRTNLRNSLDLMCTTGVYQRTQCVPGLLQRPS